MHGEQQNKLEEPSIIIPLIIIDNFFLNLWKKLPLLMVILRPLLKNNKKLSLIGLSLKKLSVSLPMNSVKN